MPAQLRRQRKPFDAQLLCSRGAQDDHLLRSFTTDVNTVRAAPPRPWLPPCRDALPFCRPAVTTKAAYVTVYPLNVTVYPLNVTVYPLRVTVHPLSAAPLSVQIRLVMKGFDEPYCSTVPRSPARRTAPRNTPCKYIWAQTIKRSHDQTIKLSNYRGHASA
jgi:hypothetical protein